MLVRTWIDEPVDLADSHEIKRSESRYLDLLEVWVVKQSFTIHAEKLGASEVKQVVSLISTPFSQCQVGVLRGYGEDHVDNREPFDSWVYSCGSTGFVKHFAKLIRKGDLAEDWEVGVHRGHEDIEKVLGDVARR